MNSLKRLLVATVLLAGCQTVDPVLDGSQRVSQALARNEPAPLLSPLYGKSLTVDKAYEIQRATLQPLLLGRRPEGFKAGLTNAPAQQQYGATEPVAGALLPGTALQADDEGYRVALKTYRHPMVEVEVGFRFAQRVTRPIPDVQSLQTYIAEVLPAVELPDLPPAGATPPRAVDIVAANVYPRHFIAGSGRAPGLTDPNAVAVTLYRDGELLNEGGGRDVLGDQWQALLWLVNRTIASGWTIEPGQVLITGAIGKPVPMQPGLYVADFGRFGRIEWAAE